MERVEEVFRELNYPSADVLKKALRNRDIPFDARAIEQLVRGEVVRQVQAPKYRFTGKIAASDLNSRLFADLIDFTAAPTDRGKSVGLKPTEDHEKYILVVQRVFDRRLWTEALTNKRPETVAEAFRRILRQIGGPVRSVTTDQGAEFGDPFKTLMEQEGIAVRTKAKDDINAISTVDVAIGYLKKALARVARKRRTDDWADILEEVTKGQNAVPNQSYLEGNAPKDVEGNQDLRRRLRKKNLEFVEHNRDQAETRAQALQDAGQFRIMLSTGGRFTRGFKPRWSDHVYRVARIDGAFVYDEDGNEYPTKFTQPVVGNAEALERRRFEGAGSAQDEARKKRVLGELAETVKNWIGFRTVALGTLGVFLGTHGFRAKALEARLNMRNPVVGFLRTFPDTFAVDGAHVKVLRGAMAFEGARRLRRLR